MANNITLGDNNPLDYNLKPIKVGGKTSPLEMSASYPDDSVNAKVKVVGDLEVTGKITGNDESGDITSVGVTSLNDASSDTTNSGSVNFVTQGSTGITTSITAGPTINITGTAATSFVKGVVELATTAETETGTDATRAVTPDGLEDGYNGSANVVTTGALASGSIASGFGNIVTGNKISTTAGLEGAILDLEAATLTTSTIGTDTVLDISQTLNAGSGENSGVGAEKYAMIKGTVTETDAAGWDSKYFIQMVGGGAGNVDKFTTDISGNVVSAGTVTSTNGVSGRFNVAGDQIAYRMSNVNQYYIANRSLSTSVSAADFTYLVHQYAQFTAHSPVKLQSWKYTGSFSSAVNYEVEVWMITPDESELIPSAAVKVGDTQTISATAQEYHILGEDDIGLGMLTGSQLYMVIRYTTSFGTKYTYGTMTMEFTNG